MEPFCLLICWVFFGGVGYGKGMIVDKNKTCYYLTEHASNLEVE